MVIKVKKIRSCLFVSTFSGEFSVRRSNWKQLEAKANKTSENIQFTELLVEILRVDNAEFQSII